MSSDTSDDEYGNFDLSEFSEADFREIDVNLALKDQGRTSTKRDEIQVSWVIPLVPSQPKPKPTASTLTASRLRWRVESINRAFKVASMPAMSDTPKIKTEAEDPVQVRRSVSEDLSSQSGGIFMSVGNTRQGSVQQNPAANIPPKIEIEVESKVPKKRKATLESQVHDSSTSTEVKRYKRSATPTPTPSFKSKNPLDEFFSAYPNFQYSRTQPVWDEFYRMVDLYELKYQAKNKAREYFRVTLVRAFNKFFGMDENDVESWRSLCCVLDIKPLPTRLRECREAVRNTYVNLVDLIDNHISERTIKIFPTEEALSMYTIGTKKFLSRDCEEAGGLLRAFAHHPFLSGRRKVSLRSWWTPNRGSKVDLYTYKISTEGGRRNTISYATHLSWRWFRRREEGKQTQLRSAATLTPELRLGRSKSPGDVDAGSSSSGLTEAFAVVSRISLRPHVRLRLRVQIDTGQAMARGGVIEEDRKGVVFQNFEEIQDGLPKSWSPRCADTRRTLSKDKSATCDTSSRMSRSLRSFTVAGHALSHKVISTAEKPMLAYRP
ncbi:hypothetical protein FPV67DRAFT_1648821 [Lyophyllum atratum]|nr:hypothetical protein FPV67DRAFT_1648821 [Lyophyllum atratum]